MPERKISQIAEYGDFQTPLELARLVCRALRIKHLRPESILEPTCGQGNFLVAALNEFPSASHVIGVEINSEHLCAARKSIRDQGTSTEVDLIHGDFFRTDWPSLLDSLEEPILVIGNPPWVTNAELGSIGSKNLPSKSNFQRYAGLDAVTGKSNFDVSEWMLIKLLESLDGRRSTVAMLCKTAVARKVLYHAWRHEFRISGSEIRRIDTKRYFGTAVDACLLIVSLSRSRRRADCLTYDQLLASRQSSMFGFRAGRLIANVESFEKWKHLCGESPYRWRSGIKHDCRKVMELSKEGEAYRNGLGELVRLERRYLFPLLKSSHLANGQCKRPTRFMLVTQRSVGQDTAEIHTLAPKTWSYLTAHSGLLDGRKSVIYRNRPSFSLFGVGDYTFAPWKVAISGFYKKLEFHVLGPWQGKPMVLDDTCYFVDCQTQAEARLVCDLLNSPAASAFYSSFIFWDAKRPITVSVLGLLDVVALAAGEGRGEELEKLLSNRC